MLSGEVFKMPSEMHPSQNEDQEINQRVRAQFGPAADAYTHSKVHRDPHALKKVLKLASPQTSDLALDIATGAGHVALALAPFVRKVVAYDMTEEMLQAAARNAATRGLTNVAIQKGIAEWLPFPHASFDIVTVRYATHHFTDAQCALCEIARVAKIGARVVIVDSTSPEDGDLDRQWNHIEKLRDHSHVRNYQPGAWRAMITGAGLRIKFEELDYCAEDGGAMSFVDWTRRVNTPPEAVEELRRIFRDASPELVEVLRIETTAEEVRFRVPQITIAAMR